MHLIVPSPIFTTVLEPSETCNHRYRASTFPLVIEAPMARPWGMCWEIETRIIYGKNKERTKKYPSSLKVKLIKPVELPTHSLTWIEDTGKFVYSQQPCDRFFVFPGATFGWLIVIIKKLEN